MLQKPNYLIFIFYIYIEIPSERPFSSFLVLFSLRNLSILFHYSSTNFYIKCFTTYQNVFKAHLKFYQLILFLLFLVKSLAFFFLNPIFSPYDIIFQNISSIYPFKSLFPFFRFPYNYSILYHILLFVRTTVMLEYGNPYCITCIPPSYFIQLSLI